MSEIPSPLRNLRVLEMTEALAGPYCAMLLGDLGADVIKIERPGVGDQSRRWGPPFLEGESAYFLSVNRNKRSVEIDFKAPEGLELLYQLVATADVLVTNVPRMASLERAKIDPATLHAINPRLIYSLISGYGHTGPKANRSGYDIIAQGEAGLMAITGDPGGGPIRFPTAMADISAGVYSTIGILSALYARDNATDGSGEGQVLDVALFDSQVTWLANIGSAVFATGERPQRLGNDHPTITPYQPFRTRDRMILVGVGTQNLWKKFCRILGVESTLMVDPRFETNPLRNENRAELSALLEEIFASRDAEAWLGELVAAGIPAGPIYFPDDTLKDEQLHARGMVVELEHPLAGLVRSIGNPVMLSKTGPTYRRYPPRLGEHNDEIQEELGAG